MIEETIKTYLEGKNFDVYLEKPSNPPAEYVLIERTGGGQVNHINTAIFAVQSYGGSLYKAAKLNEDVKAAMLDIINHVDISRCALNSDYNFTDTTTKEYRYQAVYDLVY